MFSRFSGISAWEHARRAGQLPWVGGGSPSMNGSSLNPQKAGLPQRPGGVKPSLQRKLGVVMTKPMCLCKLQRENDEARRAAR